MADHPARFPGTSNDPRTQVLSERQAQRLSALTRVPTKTMIGKPIAEISKEMRLQIDPQLFLFRRICGQVVKTDSEGNQLPVPFATVNVYDTDISLLAWSPLGWPYSWFWPLHIHREKLATVTTDECGRFCVWVPRFDIDYYLHWRVERRCYLEWLRKPLVADLLESLEPPAEPPPVRPIKPVRPLRTVAVKPLALRLSKPTLATAAKVVATPTMTRLREAADNTRPGSLEKETDATLVRPAFSDVVRPPLTKSAKAMLEPAMRKRLAGALGVPLPRLEALDSRRWFGPFLRCKTTIIPEWTPVLDIPDLSFEVTQDIDGDGQQEIIYREGLFDVRWNAGDIGEVTLVANANAIAGPSCDVPDPGVCGDPAILFAGSYPLQVPGNASPYHDASSGYALLPNRPDENGVPYNLDPGGARVSPANTPFAGRFYLIGCAERDDATHYRIHHEVGGATSFINSSFGPLMKVVGGVLQQLIVSPEDGQWYPIVPRADGWTPVGLLAPLNMTGTAVHSFRLELGRKTGTTIHPVNNSLTQPVALNIDSAVPAIEILNLFWRQPEVSLTWQPLDPNNCAVMARQGHSRVQVQLQVSVSANHLRDFWISATGCGPITAPQLITDGRDGIPTPAQSSAHWHMDPDDNAHTRTLYYELAANAQAGCYGFHIRGNSRAFNPSAPVAGSDPVVAWQALDPIHIWRQRDLSVALQ